jgi:hypothetical protein
MTDPDGRDDENPAHRDFWALLGEKLSNKQSEL